MSISKLPPTCSSPKKGPDEETECYDAVIVGGGLVGLSVGCQILERRPNAKVCILEKGLLLGGQSAKSTGLTSVASFTELFNQERSTDFEEALHALSLRQKGFSMLFQRAEKDRSIFEQSGGYTIVTDKDFQFLEQLPLLNQQLSQSAFSPSFFELRNDKIKKFGLSEELVKGLVFHKDEWQVNTAKLIVKLVGIFEQRGGRYWTGCEVASYASKLDGETRVELRNSEICFYTKKLIFCMGGLGQPKSEEKERILLTKPIKGLTIDASLTVEPGGWYMRRLDGRILFGTKDRGSGMSERAHQARMIITLKMLLPDLKFEVDYFWSVDAGRPKRSSSYVVRCLGPNVYDAYGCGECELSMCSLAAEKLFDCAFGRAPKL